MVLAVCVDNNNGMAFGNRRQSRDIAVCKDLTDSCKGNSLYIDTYSEILFADFKDFGTKILVSTSLESLECDENDCVFVEKTSPAIFADKISKIILYKWNRDYPNDMKFDIDMSAWKLISETSFPGKSHEQITKEVYRRA